MNKVRKETLYLEILRIVACFAIIFNHTGSNGFFLFIKEEMFSFNSWLYCFISIFCKFGVYIFFMISGVVLLNKDEDLSVIIKKRVLKYILIFISFEFLNYAHQVALSRSKIDLLFFFKTIYSDIGGFNFSYWFLISYICFLLALPILRVITKNINNKTFIYLIVLKIIFDIIYAIPDIFGTPRIITDMNINWLDCAYFFYPLFGFYLHNQVKSIKTSHLCVIGLINVAVILMCVYLTMNNIVINNAYFEGDESQRFYNTFALLNACFVFLFVKKIINPDKISEKARHLITICGSLTFGIYLLHLPFIYSESFAKLLLLFRETLGLNYMISCLIACLILMIGLGCVVYLYKIVKYKILRSLKV